MCGALLPERRHRSSVMGMLGVNNQEQWLRSLSPREIVWLMLELREQTHISGWFTPETGYASIAMLRQELRKRGDLAGAAV